MNVPPGRSNQLPKTKDEWFGYKYLELKSQFRKNGEQQGGPNRYHKVAVGQHVTDEKKTVRQIQHHTIKVDDSQITRE